MHVGVTVLLAIALLAAQAPFDTLRALPPDDASLARIKSALQKPAPKLIIPPPKADFRVNIEAIRPFADIFELPPWVTPPGDHDAPRTNRAAHDGTIIGVGADPGVIAHSISKAIRTRRAHAEVVEALVQYCAAHRDEPGAAGICGGPPR
jgi:hypothetical protein